MKNIALIIIIIILLLSCEKNDQTGDKTFFIENVSGIDWSDSFIHLIKHNETIHVYNINIKVGETLIIPTVCDRFYLDIPYKNDSRMISDTIDVSSRILVRRSEFNIIKIKI